MLLEKTRLSPTMAKPMSSYTLKGYVFLKCKENLPISKPFKV